VKKERNRNDGRERARDPDMASDEELVARSIGGDTDSFNQLVTRWERPIYALAYRTLGREEDARDVCQETFLRAFRSLPGFRGQAKFSSWLYRIALNLCRDWIRRERRAPVVQAPEGVDVVELAGEQGPVESIEELVSRRDLGAIVQRAMTRLSEEQRTTIILKEYQGLTFQEIADLQGCPLSTVKTRLYQGLTVLRRELDRQGVPVPGVSSRPAAAPAPARTLRRAGSDEAAADSRSALTASLRLSPPLIEPL
jgi:RNA polymerase sigma-70 factor (ECF subfamily)